MSIKYEPVLGVSPAIPAGLSVPNLYYVGLTPSGTTYGPELVVNGGFSDGFNDWTAQGGAVLGVVAGDLEVTDAIGSETSQAEQVVIADIENYIGKSFTLSVEMRNGTSAAAEVLIETSTTNIYNNANPSTTTSPLTAEFTIPAGQIGDLNVRLRAGGVIVGGTAFFDSVSIKEII